jgi:hypothetical protein
VRLTDRYSVCTATGAPGDQNSPHLERSAPGANASSFDQRKGTSNNRDSLASNDIKNAAPEAAHNAQAHPYPI